MPAGRPRKQVDARKVEQMARFGCSNDEIGMILDCSAQLLEEKFQPALKRGKSHRNYNLRKLMYENAKRGNVVMQIFLSKQWLGYRDRGPADEIEDPLGELLREFRSHYHDTATNKPNGKGEVTNGNEQRR
jgi:hypothetical protein